MQVVVFGKYMKEKNIPYIQELLDVLHAKHINVYIYAPYFKQFKDQIKFQKDVGVFEGYLDLKVKKIDFLICLGGDGTILEAVTVIMDQHVPILGINLGRLGFLASIDKGTIETAINQLCEDRFSLEERTMLFLESDKNLFGDVKIALNDFTILKRDTSSMISISAYINGAYLATYWADGIILSTPTGSTGYNLSCGGPIIFPDSGNFVLTPVAPHNLNIRPIVISDESIVSFEVEGRAENFLCTLDSRFETISSVDELAIRKNDYNIKLVQLPNKSFLSTMREKLAWGQDSRN